MPFKNSASLIAQSIMRKAKAKKMSIEAEPLSHGGQIPEDFEDEELENEEELDLHKLSDDDAKKAFTRTYLTHRAIRGRKN